MKQVLIIGNGFDLACGLRTSYKDFFEWRFEKLFFTEDEKNNIERNKRKENKKEDIENLIEDKKAKIKSKILSTTDNFHSNFDHINNYINKICNNKILPMTRWDYIFLFANNFFKKKNGEIQWQDIEKVIYYAVTVSLESPYLRSNSFFNDETTFTNNNRTDRISFHDCVRFFFTDWHDEYSNERRALIALNSLNKFENIFSQFILEKKDENQNYKSEAESLLQNLYDTAKVNKKYEIEKQEKQRIKFTNLLQNLCDATKASKNHIQTNSNHIEECNILSFNYTLSKIDYPKIYFTNTDNNKAFVSLNFRNIHGIAVNEDTKAVLAKIDTPFKDISTIIFGIDNHDILKDHNKKLDNDDLRTVFTKTFRTIDSYVSDIQDYSDYSNADVITIYGHSMGRADFSYFETIFDNNDLYKSPTCLQVYYHAEENTDEKDYSESNLLEKRKIINALVSLLTDYGESLSIGHGENIVNKMILENRIEVLPTTSLNIK